MKYPEIQVLTYIYCHYSFFLYLFSCGSNKSMKNVRLHNTSYEMSNVPR